MANLYPAQTGPFAISENWCNADDDDQDTPFTGGDSAVLTVASADPVTVDTTWMAVALSATGAANLAIADQLMSFAGTVLLDNIHATISTGQITANSIEIGIDGLLTLSDDCSMVGPLTLDGGGIVGTGGHMLTLKGDAIYTSGTAVDVNVTFTNGTHDLNWPSYSADDRFESITIDGTAIVVMTANGWCEKLIVESGGVLQGAFTLGIHSPSTGDFLGCDGGSITCTKISLFLYNNFTNSLNMYGLTCDLSFKTTGIGTHTLTTTGRMETTGDWVIFNSSDQSGWLAIDAQGTFDCNDIVIGNNEGAAEDGGGKLILSSLPVVANIGAITIGHDDNLNCALTLGSASLTTDDVIDGDNQGTNGITVTSVGANIVGRGDSAEIKEVTSDAVLHVWGLIGAATNNEFVCHESSLGGCVANLGTHLPLAA